MRLKRAAAEVVRTAALTSVGHNAGLYVERQAQHDRAPPVHGGPVGAHDVGDGRRRAVHPLGDRPDAARQTVLVDAEVGQHSGPGRVGGEHDHRRAALGGLGDPGDRVGQPTTLMSRQHPRQRREPAVAVGHRRRATLVPGRDERHAVGAQRVRDGEVATPDDTEGVPDA